MLIYPRPILVAAAGFCSEQASALVSLLNVQTSSLTVSVSFISSMLFYVDFYFRFAIISYAFYRCTCHYTTLASTIKLASAIILASTIMLASTLMLASMMIGFYDNVGFSDNAGFYNNAGFYHNAGFYDGSGFSDNAGFYGTVGFDEDDVRSVGELSDDDDS